MIAQPQASPEISGSVLEPQAALVARARSRTADLATAEDRAQAWQSNVARSLGEHERYVVVNLSNSRILAGPLSVEGVERWWQTSGQGWFGVRVVEQMVLVERCLEDRK